MDITSTHCPLSLIGAPCSDQLLKGVARCKECVGRIFVRASREEQSLDWSWLQSSVRALGVMIRAEDALASGQAGQERGP